MDCLNCDYYRESYLFNCCELTQEECFFIRTKEHPCYYINDDYIFKENVSFFGFKKGTDSRES
jgi:hypothetical protein